MVTLKSGNSAVNKAERGAELRSFKIGEKEYIWQGNPEIWIDSVPILFPICGGLKDDK